MKATQLNPDFQAEPKTYRLEWQPYYTLPQSCSDARAQWYIDIEDHEAVHYQDALNLAQAANTIWQASPPSLKYCAGTQTDAINGLLAAFRAAVLNYGQCLTAAYQQRVEDFHQTPAGAAALPSPAPSLCKCPSCEECCHGACQEVTCGECSLCLNDTCVPAGNCSCTPPCFDDCPPRFGSRVLSVGQLATPIVCCCSPCCPGCSTEACGLSFYLTQTNPGVVAMSFSPDGPWVSSLYVPVTVDINGVPQIPTVYRKAFSSGISKEEVDCFGCSHIFTWTVPCQ